MIKTDPTAPRGAIRADDPDAPADVIPRTAEAIRQPVVDRALPPTEVLVAAVLGFALGFATALAYARRR